MFNYQLLKRYLTLKANQKNQIVTLELLILFDQFILNTLKTNCTNYP